MACASEIMLNCAGVCAPDITLFKPLQPYFMQNSLALCIGRKLVSPLTATRPKTRDMALYTEGCGTAVSGLTGVPLFYIFTL